MTDKKKHNIERERMLYMLGVRDLLLESFNKGEAGLLQEEIYKLCEQNQNLLDCKTASFIYKDQWYSVVHPLPRPPEMEKWNRILHPSLLQPVSELLDDNDFTKIQEKALLQSFFQNVLGACNHTTDLVRLLPATFLDQLPAMAPEVINIGDPLTHEEIQTIKQANEEGMNLLTRMAMTALLLNGR